LKFAKIVFWLAAIWGFLIITPLYFMFTLISKNDPPPITHPGFFYGFVGVAMVWQLAFILIARDPVRFRPMMIPAILEKLVYSIPSSSSFCKSACIQPILSSAPPTFS
jgi:hypothetical protein